MVYLPRSEYSISPMCYNKGLYGESQRFTTLLVLRIILATHAREYVHGIIYIRYAHTQTHTDPAGV